MRLIWLVGGLAIAFPGWAQQQQRGMYGGVSTGRMVGDVSDPGFAARMGATVGGLPQTTTQIPINGGIYGNTLPARHGSPGSHRQNTLIVPYGVPMVYGGGYANYDQAPQVAVQHPVENTPSVIINQYFTPETARPEMREYTNLPEPVRPRTTRPQPAQPPKETAAATNPAAADQPSGDKPTVTLLAFKDSSVTMVIAYWAQNTDLHYITKGYKKNVVPIGTLDRATSEKLNKERQVEFTLE